MSECWKEAAAKVQLLGKHRYIKSWEWAITADPRFDCRDMLVVEGLTSMCTDDV
jgi:hypothetical protein